MAFPYHNRGTYDAATGTFLSNSRALTSAEVTALKNEYTTDPTARGYAGKTATQVQQLINTPYSIPNPTPQPTLKVIDRETFVHLISPIVLGVIASTNTVLAQKYGQLWQMVIPTLNALNTVDLTQPIVQNLTNMLVTDGVITQTQANGLLNIPDPTWQPTILAPARCDVIFSIPLELELADIQNALGIS